MKKTIFNYSAILAFIYLSYLLFAIVLAILYHYVSLQPSFYSMATKLLSYTVVLLAGLGFGLLIPQKRLLNALLFCLIFSVINTLLLWHHFDLWAILLKNLAFILGTLVINIVKK